MTKLISSGGRLLGTSGGGLWYAADDVDCECSCEVIATSCGPGCFLLALNTDGFGDPIDLNLVRVTTQGGIYRLRPSSTSTLIVSHIVTQAPTTTFSQFYEWYVPGSGTPGSWLAAGTITISFTGVPEFYCPSNGTINARVNFTVDFSSMWSNVPFNTDPDNDPELEIDIIGGPILTTVLPYAWASAEVSLPAPVLPATPPVWDVNARLFSNRLGVRTLLTSVVTTIRYQDCP